MVAVNTLQSDDVVGRPWNLALVEILFKGTALVGETIGVVVLGIQEVLTDRQGRKTRVLRRQKEGQSAKSSSTVAKTPR